MGIKIHTSDVWSILTPVLKISLKASAGLPNPEAAIEVIAVVIKIIEGQGDGEVLKGIDEKVQRLIDEHIKSGKDYLASATVKTLDKNRRDSYLMQALDKFTSAKNLLPLPENIRAMTYAAVCYQCLGDEENARKWYKDSYEAAVKYWGDISSIVRKIENPSPVQRSADGLLAMSSMFVVPLLLAVPLSASTSNKHYDSVVKLFDIEVQMRQLQQVLASARVQYEPLTFYFPDNVVRVKKKIKLTSQFIVDKSLECFDENGITVGEITLGSFGGKRFWNRRTGT